MNSVSAEVRVTIQGGVPEVCVWNRCHEFYVILLTYASDLVPKITCQVV